MKPKQVLGFLNPDLIEKFLFFLIIVFLPTQLGRHFWPDFSYIYSLKIDYLAVTLYFWEILVYLLWISYILKKRIFNKRTGVFLAILFISACYSLFFSNNWLVGISRVINWIPAALLALYVSSKPASIVKHTILKYLPYSLLIVCVLAFLQFILGRTIGLWVLGERSFDLSTPGIATFNWYGEVFLRPYATFSHPNVLAAFTLLCGLLLLFLNQIKSMFILITQVSVLLTVLLSFSRASIAVISILGLFLFRKQLYLVVLVFVLLSPLLFVRFESAFNFDQISLTRREELAESAWTIAKEHPFVGVGLNNYIPTAVDSSFLSGTNRFLQPVHNIFLLMLSETGLVGFLGFLVFFISPLFFHSEKNLLKKSQIVAFLLTISFLGMLDHYFLTLPQGQRILFLIWGVSWTKY
jgi:O-antigen ligase